MAADIQYGLNKEARLAAERKAAAVKDLSALRIQPDFPYTAQSFDPGFFGLGAAPSPADPPPE